MPWILSENWKINFYYFNLPFIYFFFPIILSLCSFLSPNPITSPLSLASRFSDKALSEISRNIFHCLLVTEALIKCSESFPSQVHGTLPCILGKQLLSSYVLRDNMLKRPKQWKLEMCTACAMCQLPRYHMKNKWQVTDRTLAPSELSNRVSKSQLSYLNHLIIHNTQVVISSTIFSHLPYPIHLGLPQAAGAAKLRLC